MKPRANRLSYAFALVMAMASGAGLSAGGPRDAGQVDAIPTVVVQAPRPAMATVVVSAVKNSEGAIQPLLVVLVMTLFGGVVLRMRQHSRKLKI